MKSYENSQICEYFGNLTKAIPVNSGELRWNPLSLKNQTKNQLNHTNPPQNTSPRPFLPAKKTLKTIEIKLKSRSWTWNSSWTIASKIPKP